jgi:CMP-N,N'-diacetyllegionaminic acid synthase
VIGGLRVLAVVPARGGSKGLPRKNLLPVGGVPLVARVGDVVMACTEIDRAVVSTDDEEIAAAAVDAGLDAPFRRPEALSGDRIGDIDVLQHALAATEQDDGTRYDVIVMLQPTSPLRTAEQVAATLRRLVADDLDAAWTVSPTDGKAHPVKQLRVVDGLLAFDHPDGAAVIARQQLAPLWHRNGIAYALRRATLESGRLMGVRTGAVVIDGPVANIDDALDLEWAEFLLARARRASAQDASAQDDGA